MKYFIGIDLGGTNVKAAVVNGAGEIIASAHLDCPRNDGDEAIISTIDQTVRLAAESAGITIQQVEAIGIGTPGIANSETGVVEYSCNLGFHNTPLGAELTRRLGKEVLVENDANVAALGEMIAGSGKGVTSLVAVTLGTGIGGGVVTNGRLLTGFNHAGAELGHIVIVKDGQQCGCGRKGCWEAYASATALIRETKEAMEKHPESLIWKLVDGDPEKVDGRTAFDAKAQGDAVGAQVVREYAEYLAAGLVNIVNIFQPEIICVGGGISNAGQVLLDPVQEILDREDYARDSARRCRLVRATLGNDAGLIGAALLCRYRG